MFYSVGRFIKDTIRTSQLPIVTRQMHREMAGFKSSDDAVAFSYAFGSCEIYIRPNQIRGEITEFLRLLARRPPATVMEVGTERGGTFFLLAAVSTPDAVLVSLDLPPEKYSFYPKWREKLYRRFARDRQRIEILRGDSHAPAALEKARACLNGRKLDLLFIDGDHSYDGVKKDFEMYSTLLAPDGIIAFHDIVDGPDFAVGGVPKFWRELKQGRQHLEIVHDWKQGGWGIGVLLPPGGI